MIVMSICKYTIISCKDFVPLMYTIKAKKITTTIIVNKIILFFAFRSLILFNSTKDVVSQ